MRANTSSSSGSIHRLEIYEADADPDRRDELTDEEILARRKPPSSIVVRYSAMQLVAEYPYDGPAKPGCGSKLVARTNRGLEIVEMLTTTCANSGCGKSVSRKEMLGYIENSGGQDYPFRTDGKIMRVATVDDMNRWSAIQAETREQVGAIKHTIAEAKLTTSVNLIDVESILSQEVLTIYYSAEERVDFRGLVQTLAKTHGCRIEMRQVGARDEARLVADYEKCGQHCCCKNFLKVLKPVSMRSAKVQKATLDPLKISGRCGRLMCCLRYEDETYSELKKRLPHRKTRVGTPEGPGIVIDSKILVQLVLVKLELDGRQIAVPVEELGDPDAPITKTVEDPMRGFGNAQETKGETNKKPRRRRSPKSGAKQQTDFRGAAQAEDAKPGAAIDSDALASDGLTEAPKLPKKKKSRRRRRGLGKDETGQARGDSQAKPTVTGASSSDEASTPKKKRRRRRGGKRRGGQKRDGDDAPRNSEG